MTKVRKVDFSPDEFLVGIAGLRAAEVGVYWVICSMIYATGGPIPIDDERVLRVLKEPRNKAMGFITSLINKGKLVQIGSNVDNARCARELNAAQTRIENSQKNGRFGGRPSKKSMGSQNPQQKPITNYNKIKINKINGVGINGNGHSHPTDEQRTAWYIQGCENWIRQTWPDKRAQAAIISFTKGEEFGIQEYKRAWAERKARKAEGAALMEGDGE